MQITVQFQPSKEDHVKTSKAFLIPIKIAVVAGLLLFEIFLGRYALNTPELATRADWYTPFAFPCLGPIFGIFILFAWPVMNDNKIRNFAEQNKQLLEPISWIFLENEVAFRGANTEITYDWRAFHDAFEIEDYVLLSHPANRKTYFFIPKSSFKSKEEQGNFINLVERQTGKKFGTRTFVVKILIPLIRYIGFVMLIFLGLMYVLKLVELIF